LFYEKDFFPNEKFVVNENDFPANLNTIISERVTWYNNQVAPRSRAVLEKPIVTQLVKEFSAFYGT
jgi:hypothetical protein